MVLRKNIKNNRPNLNLQWCKYFFARDPPKAECAFCDILYFISLIHFVEIKQVYIFFIFFMFFLKNGEPGSRKKFVIRFSKEMTHLPICYSFTDMLLIYRYVTYLPICYLFTDMLLIYRYNITNYCNIIFIQ